VCARVETDSGLVRIECLAIHRLRGALDKARRGLGKRLIVTGIGEEYRLAIPKGKMRQRVGIAPCFWDLVRLKLVTEAQATILRKGCRKSKLRELEE
jgi:hypothetical protein